MALNNVTTIESGEIAQQCVLFMVALHFSFPNREKSFGSSRKVQDIFVPL